jgi:chorismate mutase-like protein
VSEASLKVRGPVVDAVTVSDEGRFMGGVGQHTAPGPSLESLRRDLDRIDECLLETLRARIDCCVQIAHVKHRDGVPMMQPHRIGIVHERAARYAAAHDIDSSFLSKLYDLIIGETCRVEDAVIREASAALKTEMSEDANDPY